MRKLLIFILAVLIVSFISSLCEEEQIDINTASLEELDELYGIGPVKAEAIIDSRPFSSVDDLTNVYGIGEKTLNKIKEQGLACVDEETQNIEENNILEEENETNEKVNNNLTISESASNSTTKSNSDGGTYTPKITTKIITLDIINLNSKDIKSEDNKEILKKNLALGGIIIFCVGFGALFLLKFVRGGSKNEFRL